MIPSFPKVFTIGQPYIKNIFDTEVFISEKLDGSQFSFGKINGEVLCRSKNKHLTLDNPEKMFTGAVQYVLSISNILPEDMVFYGEWFQRPRHNVISYDKTPKNGLALFCIKHGDEYLFDTESLEKYSNLLNIDYVPTLFYGKVNDVEQLENLLNMKSYLGGPYMEGIVVKQSTPVIVGHDVVPFTCGKYVSEKFKEVHKKNWKSENTSRGSWEVFKSQYKSEARWSKAVQHLREKGELLESPKDIGNLIKEVQRDIKEECEKEIVEFLIRTFLPEVTRESVKGLPEWYKSLLMKNSMNDQT